MINLQNIETDIPRQQAIWAYNNVSFSPEKRAEGIIADYVKVLTALADHITENAKDERQKAIAQEVFDRLREKYKAKTLNWLSAKSRCISSMITGPANFPVRRAEKANNSEHNRMGELIGLEKAMFRYAEKSLSYVMPKESVLGVAETQLKKMKEYQVFAKQVNALLRKQDQEALKALYAAFYPEEVQAITEYNKRCIIPNCWGGFGYEGFHLTSVNNKIKALEERLSTFEKAATTEQKLNGLEIVRNLQEDRLQLLFDGKPEEAERSFLKSNGFKWSPRFKAWQRQLTANAEVVLTHRVLTNPMFEKYKELTQ